MTINLAKSVWLDDKDVTWRFVRASGPGGQNVNKVSSAVELRVSLADIAGLPPDARARLVKLAGSRLNQDGVLVIQAQQFRSQERNRADALERLSALVARALIRPRPRRATRPTKASKERRLQSKTQRSRTKTLRGRVRDRD
jgi:ribosome-associated protein